MANLSPKLDKILADVIPATSIKIVDKIALSDFSKLTYDTSFNGNLKEKGFLLTVINANSQLFDSIGFRLGDLPLQLDVSISGLEAEIKVINPNAFDINFKALRHIF